MSNGKIYIIIKDDNFAWTDSKTYVYQFFSDTLKRNIKEYTIIEFNEDEVPERIDFHLVQEYEITMYSDIYFMRWCDMETIDEYICNGTDFTINTSNKLITLIESLKFDNREKKIIKEGLAGLKELNYIMDDGYWDGVCPPSIINHIMDQGLIM